MQKSRGELEVCIIPNPILGQMVTSLAARDELEAFEAKESHRVH
jgi:hypothetical protein